MNVSTTVLLFLAAMACSVARAAPESPTLSHQLTVTPEIKLAFADGDWIELWEVTGTAPSFQVGGTYRIKGTCRQTTLRHGIIYIGNTSEPGAAAIIPAVGSSLYQAIPDGTTQLDCTFTLLRPGILHVTVYDADNHDEHDNAHEGVYIGDVVFPH